MSHARAFPKNMAGESAVEHLAGLGVHLLRTTGRETMMPRVSLGLPVYNGERFLTEVLESILAQTYDDFELIISNNASTDRTDEICRRYAAKDSRIRYVKNEVNVGAARNFCRVFELAKGEYFKWAACDDVCAPEYLAECVRVLDDNPSVVLCYPETKRIDEDGRFLRDYAPDLDIASPSPQRRFHSLLMRRHGCIEVFGLMRAEVLRKTPLIAGYYGSDRVLLGELSLHGPFHLIPRPLFFSRVHERQSFRAFPSAQAFTAWFDPRKARSIVLPEWRYFVEYCAAIGRAPLAWPERAGCYRVMGQWLRGHARPLAHEVPAAAKQFLRRSPTGERVLALLKRILKGNKKTSLETPDRPQPE